MLTERVRMTSKQEVLIELVFDHGKAKALWPGWYLVKEGFYKGVPSENWRRHLQQMVTADDPLEYLKEHIDDGDSPPPDHVRWGKKK